jgi:two-component system OmpR family sensor kinase
MSPTERARDRRLLIELSRINNDYGLLQREAMRDLANSRQELTEARSVLGAVAHDLRTPLQAVIGFAEFLLEEDLEPDQRELAERIAHAGHVMSELTEDLLSTIIGRRSMAPTETVDLAALVTEVTSRYDLLAGRSGTTVELDVTVPRELLTTGDPAKLRRAFENLITNAIKFSPAHGTVRVTLEARDDGITFQVSDDGPGIDPAEHGAVFEPFHRAAGSANVPGVGLGLPIVKQIAEQHGGTVTVASARGAGATFVVRLPLLGQVGSPGA